MTTHNPLDVWLKFYDPAQCEDGEDYLAEYEANTFKCKDGSYRVEWYHNDVGQVSTARFDSRGEATKWLEANGFEDFSS